MRIHPKKCTVQSNYDSTGIMLGDINAETGYKTNDKKEILAYLGAPMPVIDPNGIFDSLIKEISFIVDKAIPKRISSCIASYIVQMIIYPILIYRQCGREHITQCQKKIESTCLKLIKKKTGLSKSFPHTILQTNFLPIAIRNFSDVYEEHEVTGFIGWINSDKLIGCT